MNAGDTAWVLVSAALVLFMTPGLALFYGGMVRSNNVLGMLMQNLFAMGSRLNIWGEIFSCLVAFHVQPRLPQLAITDVNNLSLADNVYRTSILAIELRQRFQIEFFHYSIPL